MIKTINNFYDLIKDAIHTKRYESIPRVKQIHHIKRGLRNIPIEATFILHKYTIKNGISLNEVIIKNVIKNNSLLKRLMIK